MNSMKCHMSIAETESATQSLLYRLIKVSISLNYVWVVVSDIQNSIIIPLAASNYDHNYNLGMAPTQASLVFTTASTTTTTTGNMGIK